MAGGVFHTSLFKTTIIQQPNGSLSIVTFTKQIGYTGAKMGSTMQTKWVKNLEQHIHLSQGRIYYTVTLIIISFLELDNVTEAKPPNLNNTVVNKTQLSAWFIQFKSIIIKTSRNRNCEAVLR